MNNDELDLIERQHPLYEDIMSKILKECFKEECSECINIDNIKSWLQSLAN